MIHYRYYSDLTLFKEKSWSVRLVDGFITDNRVRSQECENCDATSQIVAINRADPNLALYGCSNRKCKHILMRMKISSEAKEPEVLDRAEEFALVNASISS
jgi:hypothetical protein